MLPLSQLPINTDVLVCEVKGSGPIRQRLFDMGILPEVNLRIERISLAGGTIWIEFEGRHLALRKQEANTIFVKKVV